MKWKNQRRWFSLVFLFFTFPAWAGSFSSDFNSGLPENLKTFGHAHVSDSGGFGDGGVLKLTINEPRQAGAVRLDPLDNGQPIAGFTARFKALIGSGRGGGDGFSFCFAPDYTNNLINELGGGSGLIVTFDTYKNSVDKVAPGVRVYWQKQLVAETNANLRLSRFADVLLEVDSAGKFNLDYDGVSVFKNLPLAPLNIDGQFAFGSRTGGWFDNHWIDDLHITTQSAMPAFVEAFSPSGDNAAPDAILEIVLADSKKVNPSSLRLQWNGTTVIPQIATNAANLPVIQYQPPELLMPGSNHLVQLSLVEPGETPQTNSFTYRFSVNPHILLSK